MQFTYKNIFCYNEQVGLSLINKDSLGYKKKCYEQIHDSLFMINTL